MPSWSTAAMATTLDVRDNGSGHLTVGMTGTTGAINLQGGSLGALTELSTTTIPGLRTRLDALAKGIVTEVNALHRSGTGLAGSTGVDFFNPTGVTAGSMAVSLSIQFSTDNIAAGKNGAAGDNANALALAWPPDRRCRLLRRQHDRRGVPGPGLRARRAWCANATDKQTAQEIVVSHADTLRQSISGVSVDEELTTAHRPAERLQGGCQAGDRRGRHDPGADRDGAVTTRTEEAKGTRADSQSSPGRGDPY